MGHDDTGIGSGWFVETLEVEIPVRGEAYVFAVNRWLDKEEMDGRIEIDLYPTEVKHTDASWCCFVFFPFLMSIPVLVVNRGRKN